MQQVHVLYVGDFEAGLKIANEIYNSRARSPINGLPELDRTVLEQFKSISNEKFVTLPKVEFKFTYDGKVFVSRGRYIAHSTAIKIGIIPGLLQTCKSISRINLAYIPSSFRELLLALEGYLKIDSKAYIESDSNRVCNWLMCFSVYPEFALYYEEYLLDPDSWVSIITKNTPKDEIGITLGAEIKFLNSNDKITNMSVVVSVYLLLISMNKSFTSEEKLNTYIEQHVKQLSTVVQVPTAYLVFDQRFFMHFSKIMAGLPNLKKKLFYFAYENRSKYLELELAVTVMLKSTMTLVYDILKFINVEKQCEAHRHSIIRTEIKDFLTVFEEKKKKEGLMWPYYRFINPSDTSIILGQCLELLAAAILYWKSKLVATYRDYTFMPRNLTISNLDSIVKQHQPQTNVILDSQEEICARMKRDLDAVMCATEYLNSIDVIGDDQTINLLMRSFRK